MEPGNTRWDADPPGDLEPDMVVSDSRLDLEVNSRGRHRTPAQGSCRLGPVPEGGRQCLLRHAPKQARTPARLQLL